MRWPASSEMSPCPCTINNMPSREPLLIHVSNFQGYLFDVDGELAVGMPCV